jgi:uncharacterized membrane protein YbhN (UPF0104 family)
MIEIEGQITAQDYVRAQYLHLRPRPLFGYLEVGLLLFSVLIVGFGIFTFVRDGENPTWWLVLLAVGGYLAAYFLWYLPWQTRRRYAQHKALQSPFRIRVDEEGVFAENEYGQALLPWSFFLKWKEGRHLFLIYHTDGLFQMIPKRSIKSESDIEALRALLSSHARRQA